MDIEKINEELGRRFSVPLPEFCSRRLVFWYDEGREFEERLNEVSVEGVKLISLTGSNMFSVKKTLVSDDPDSNYIVYVPLMFERLEDNWLLNLELYSGEPFRADIYALWLEEMGLEQTQTNHKMVKSYRKFFNNVQRRTKFSRYTGNISGEMQFHLAVMASICGCENNPMDIIRAVLQCGDNPESNNHYRDIETYGALSVFWEMAKQGTGYVGNDLSELMQTVFITAAARHSECFAGLDRFNCTEKGSRCYDLVSDWLKDDAGLYDCARKVEQDLRLVQRFKAQDVDSISGIECFPCINEVILGKVMEDVSQGIIDPAMIVRTAERRRTCKWFDRFEIYYNGLSQVAEMESFLRAHASGWHETDPEAIWQDYVRDEYRMDTFYRRFHVAFSESLLSQDSDLGDLFKKVSDTVEGLYMQFISGLGACWATAGAEELLNKGSVGIIPRQEDFYRRLIMSSETRTFVIISDAMRFEVGAQLAAELRRTQGNTTITSMCGIFPTITPFGMAALLPHTSMSVERKGGRLAVLCDGMGTESTNRETVLKASRDRSTAVKYSDLVALRKEERRALVKGMEVIYIYHDRIDAAGHGSDSVFSACGKAVDEILNMVRIITNDLSGVRILITADHGFLYTAKPLTEDARLSKENWNGKDIDNGRRYAIMEKGAEPAYMMPVRFIDGRYDAFVPMENIRIRMQGGGDQFVHGGASLQEMVIPLIEYRYIRNTSAEYQNNRDRYDVRPVTLELVSSVRKITNKSFFLNFLQREAVDDRHEAVRYVARFENSTGTVISDTVDIIADRTEENRQDRTFRSQFNLKDLAFDSHETYYLVIVDKEGLQIPQRYEFNIDIAFATDAFDFF